MLNLIILLLLSLGPAHAQSCPVPGQGTLAAPTPGPMTAPPPQAFSQPVDCPAPPPTPVNGTCSSPAGACSAGIATTPACNGTTCVWTCQGQNGGTSASCSAPDSNPPPPPPPTTIQMGETTVFADTDSGNANLLLAQDVTLTRAGTIQSLSFYARTAAGTMRLGLYDAAGNIIVQTGSFTPVAGWNTQPVGQVLLAPGGYWLAYTPNSPNLSFPVSRLSGMHCKYVGRSFQAMPAIFPAGATNDQCHWSFYATLSVP